MRNLMVRFLLVIYPMGVWSYSSDCNDEGASRQCAKPTNMLQIQRQTSYSLFYTCSNEFAQFTCTREGRFPDLADTSCTWYFECIVSRGVFLHRYVQCPKNKFSPVLQTCSSDYTCPCDVATEQPSIPDPEWWCTDITIPEFKCKRAGRFPDLRDNTCRQYFLCSKFHNDTWSIKSYTCFNSVFDPISEKCSLNYTCPCAVYPSTTTSKPKTTSTTLSTTTTTSGYLCRPNVLTYVNDFHCDRIGRYPDLGDTKCQKYFLCSNLRNGTWIKTKYACKSSTFDTLISKCSIHYSCPCGDTTTTTELATSTEATTATTGALSCIPSSEPFKCVSRGRFQDPGDFWCKNYFLCTLLSAGEWLQTNYTCSGSSLFDPTKGKCSNDFVCPCDMETTNKVVTTSPTGASCLPMIMPFECLAQGRFQDPSDPFCKKYFLCTLLRNSTMLKSSFSCSGLSYFDPVGGKCSSSYTCQCADATTVPSTKKFQATDIVTKTPIESTCKSVTVPFVCTSKGRFQDPSDVTCHNYFLCSLLSNGTWLQTGNTCSGESFFDPAQAMCSSSYVCPCISSITTVSDFTETEMTMAPPTMSACVPVTTQYHCSSKGRFQDATDVWCKNYFLCTMLRNGTWLQTGYTCSGLSFFDPANAKCSSSYRCPCVSQTITTESTTTVLGAKTTTIAHELATTENFDTIVPATSEVTATTVKIITTGSTTTELVAVTQKVTTTAIAPTCVPAKKPFECLSSGRFQDPSDILCKRYILCTMLGDGTWLQTQYSCIMSSLFDPREAKCSNSYTCSCNSEAATVSPTTPSLCIPGDSNHQCTKVGRFPDLSDLQCQTYFLCAQHHNGTWSKKSYKCTSSTFDPEIQKCSLTYRCPCALDPTEIPIVNNTDLVNTCAQPLELLSDFVCTRAGRYPDVSDPNCKKYFLCSLLRNGSLIKTRYSCSGSTFETDIQKCNVAYKCPCLTYYTTPLYT